MVRRLWLAGLVAALVPASGIAAPSAHFDRVEYRSPPQPPVAADQFRNPVLPGFQPDPSVVRVGDDFYLVTSTFGWFPGIPVYHSRDLVNWRLVSHAISRGGQLPIVDLGTNRAVFAPTISHIGGKFRVINTCVACGGNFMVEADRPEGPWSDPIWLDFPGIDPSLFQDDDGRAWVVHNAPPQGGSTYEGHMAVWLRPIDLGTGRLTGPGRQLVSGGVRPEDKPIWIEGPHLFKKDGWYYLSPAEGGTEVNHAQTIYRSRSVEGPYEPGPGNPILTQRDLPRPRPDAVEDTGHGDMVELPDGSWWMVFLATRPFAGKSTLLGRETFLLPVTWKDGWPEVLPKGEPVPLVLKRPNLPADARVDWSAWSDRFASGKLDPEWLRLRSPIAEQWFSAGAGLTLVARADRPGSTKGQPAFLGRRLRHPVATITTTIEFAPQASGDFAGLMAFHNEEHFMAVGITGNGSKREIAVRMRSSGAQPGTGVTLATMPLTVRGKIDLSIAITNGTAQFAWRPAGTTAWRVVADKVETEHMSSIHAGLFTGTMVGPYAQAGG